MLSIFTSNMEIGYYSIGKQISRYLPTFAAGIGAATGPLFAHINEANKTRLKVIFLKSFFGILVFYSLACLVLLIFTKEIITLLYGTTYLNAVPMLRVLLIFILSFSVGSLISPQIDYLGLAKKRAIAIIIAIGLNIILNLILIPKYGGLGAAIGTVASYTPYTLYNLNTLWRALS